jgi:hypothetical protein
MSSDMSDERIRKAMEFLLYHQAKHEVEILQIRELAAKNEQEIAEFLKTVREMSEQTATIQEAITNLVMHAEADRAEIRNSIGKLVDIVENSRDFSQQVARLAIATEKRVTMLEERNH